jgi:hypothetical protein
VPFDGFERSAISVFVQCPYDILGFEMHPLESVIDYKPFVAVVAEELLLRTGSVVTHPFLRDILRAAMVADSHPNHPTTIWKQ